MNRKKTLLIAAILAVVTVAVVLFGSKQSKELQGVQIGVILPLTGDGAVYGSALKNGIELARKVRNRFPELPILLTTGYSEEVGGSHGFPVLQKPYEMGALASALGNLLKQEIAVS